MKKVVALLLVCMLALAAASSLAEGAKFVTIKEWLDAKGECGDCMLVLRIKTVLNPVLAIAEDETGEINLFSGNGPDTMIVPFMGEDCVGEGFIIVIANPRFNEYEGTIEMADWEILRIIPNPDPQE